jgi:hypothetical protein
MTFHRGLYCEKTTVLINVFSQYRYKSKNSFWLLYLTRVSIVNDILYEPTLDTCTLYIYIYLRLFTNTHLYESIMSNPSNIYLSPFTKSWKWVVMYLCARGIHVCSFYDFDIRFWNCVRFQHKNDVRFVFISCYL